MSSAVATWSLGGVMVSTLAWSVIDVGLIPALCAMFPIFITPMTHCWCDQDPVQAMHCTVVEPSM